MNTIRYFGSPTTVDGGERRAEVGHAARGAQGQVTCTHAARNNEAESWPVNDNLGSSRTLLEVEGVININSCVCCGCGHANCSR